MKVDNNNIYLDSSFENDEISEDHSSNIRKVDKDNIYFDARFENDDFLEYHGFQKHNLGRCGYNYTIIRDAFEPIPRCSLGFTNDRIDEFYEEPKDENLHEFDIFIDMFENVDFDAVIPVDGGLYHAVIYSDKYDDDEIIVNMFDDYSEYNDPPSKYNNINREYHTCNNDCAENCDLADGDYDVYYNYDCSEDEDCNNSDNYVEDNHCGGIYYIDYYEDCDSTNNEDGDEDEDEDCDSIDDYEVYYNYKDEDCDSTDN